MSTGPVTGVTREEFQALVERVAYLEGRNAERDQRPRRSGPPVFPLRRTCTGCGKAGVPQGASVCSLCGEEQIEPFREGWDESD